MTVGTWSPFVGRVEELKLLRSCASEAVAGRPWTVVIEGSAGSGKSALLAEFARSLDGFIVIAAHCDEMAIETTLWAARQLAPLVEVEPFAAGMELLGAVAGLQADGPVAVLIEDLHWSDAVSRQAILAALRRFQADRVVVVVTTRPAARAGADGWMRLANDATRCRHLILEPLTVDQVVELASCHDVPIGRRAAIRLHGHTAGHALYVQMLLRELSLEQLNGMGVLPAPRTLALTTVALIGELPQQAAALVSALAVAGGSTPLAVLATVSAVGDATEALGHALSTGLIALDPLATVPTVRFAHPLHRQAVYDDLAMTERRRLHLALAALSDSTVALSHRVAAADRADDRLATALEAAALATTDPLVAAGNLASAAALSTDPSLATRRLLAGGGILRARGNAAALQPLAARLSACPPSPRRSLVLGWLAWQTGEATEAERLMLEGIADPEASPVDRAEVLAQLAGMYLSESRGPEALTAAASALALDALPEDLVQAVRVLIVGGTSLTEGGARGLEVLLSFFPEPWDDLARLDGSVIFARAIQLTYATRTAEALRWFAILAASRHAGRSFFVNERRSFVHFNHAITHIAAGSWDAALVESHTAVDLATDDAQYWVLAVAHSATAIVHAGRGQWNHAARHLQLAERASERAPIRQAVMMTGRAQAAIAQAHGSPDDVVRSLTPLIDAHPPLPPVWLLQIWPTLINALFDNDQADTASAQLARYLDSARQQRVDVSMQQHAFEARRSAAAGDATNATLHHRAAMELMNDDHDLIERVLLMHSAARHLRAIGQRREAGATLARARQLAAGVFADPYIERLDADLFGTNRSAVAASNDPFVSLTERERDVVTLVVAGQTNREVANGLYVSVKSIEFHLGNAYAKLGLRNRRELISVLKPT